MSKPRENEFGHRAVANFARQLLLVTSLTLSIGVSAQSLYDEASFRPLTSDNKAFRVGDILTVQVFENSSASTTSDTDTRRKNNLGLDLSRDGNHLKQLGVSVNGDFDGGGRTQRANRLLATISVTVRQIEKNGDLQVSGEQILAVNEEAQKVKLEGRVRPVDISEANIVLSTRLADAHITYVGEGELTERQKRGWWRKVLDWFGL